MSHNNRKRFWSTNELIIAYYIAKWDYIGLDLSEEDLIEYVIKDTTANSLKMQVANFRYLLNIEGSQLQHASKLMRQIADDLQHKTRIQVKRIIKSYVRDIDANIEIRGRKEDNKKAYKKRDELNAQYKINFENKLKAYRKRGIRLTPKSK